ncbi:unconventional myosin-IXAa-like isoform X7 [Salvelinus fontinalis]|uniref:unconventional myosin-IXAa-like isoform X7 n=1 Tax=Salvelinus fontinalis TaxID=8038 RepID=UPI002484DDE7|nr:unconventional myosin-IXAa-like isoform X7 [Salvelinus fontinalis]
MSLQDGGCGYASANLAANAVSGSMRRRLEDQDFTLRVYPGALAEGTIYCPVGARKSTTAAEAIERLLERLSLDRTKCYVLAEVKEFGGEEWILNPSDCPVQRMMLWPRNALENRCGLGSGEDYRFLLREKNLDGSIHYGGSLQMWLRVTEERRRLVERGFLPQPAGGEHPADLCALPELTERALLESLRSRFRQEKIYTYVGSILIVINPFQFLPIYNPKYVKMYDNHALGDMEPHIYAVADVAYHAMLQRRRNQCIVISGESGSGKTQSTNFLIHHLTALSQKGFASGVEQIILGAGPVLEAFGNAKTAHNDNSSRFGKFIQVNYQESGTVRGAYVEKYLLEKSRLVYQEHNERNYHVFYYLLAGATEEERKSFHLLKPEEYHYLNQITKKSHRLHWENDNETWLQDCFTVEGEDLKHDFERLQLAMDMVGFLPATRKQIFSLLSAILYLGNILYKKKTYRDDSIDICNPDVLPTISELLQVKEEMLFEALTTRKTVTVGEKLIVPYKLAEAGTVRDSMAKSLYSALFDWIVFRTNHALLNNKDLEHSAKILSIGVLDIFGFEDYENNSFEQFCINLANERLHHYFNQHLFKLEQEEYRAEGISWHNIDYIDNTGCINLISKKPTALLHLLDEECNFPQASNQTLLDKFKRQHEGNSYIEFPAVMEPAFIICHYAGKVKYGIKDFREKNTDHMRPDIVALLKSSKNAFICGLMGIDPVATFRWAVLRTYFRAMVAFREAGKRHADKKTVNDAAVPCVVKTVDSFSFLHHPVHQRSLEILQRCKDEKYNITRKNPRTPLSDLQGSNTLKEKPTRDGYGVGCNGRRSRQGGLSSSGSEFDDGIFFNSTSSKLLERAQSILMRNKNYKSKPSLPKHLLDVKSLRYLSSVTLHDRITKSLLLLHKKKKTPSISAQFQASLNKLMETLGQSEPYFVKCVRSNAEKLPLRFNDALVLRQLRYTGMLETVRIRQSGYAIKYTFQDFVRHFRVLLPDITRPTKSGIREFFRQVHLAPAGYQVGNTMVFLRDAERQRLQALLHKEVLGRIVTLQRRFRARLERKHFINMRQAADVIQRWWRGCLLRQSEAAVDPAVQEEAAVDPAVQEEAAVDPAVQEEAAVDPAVQEEAAVDPAVQEEAAVDPAVQEEAAVDPAVQEEAAVDPAVQEEAAVDPAVQEEAAVDPAVQEEAAVDPAVQEEAAVDPAVQEEAAVDPAVQEEAAVDPAVQEEAAVDPAVQVEAAVDPAVQVEAAVCLQASWRGYRQCRQFLQWRDSALIIQRRWRNCCQHRALAAIMVQTAWRVYRERAHYRRTRGAVMLLQAACRGYLARLRFTELKEQEKQLLNGQSSPTTEEEKADRTTGLDTDISEDHVVEITHDHGIQDVSTVWPTEDSKESRWKCLVEEEEDRESERRPCIEESSRQSIEPSSHKTRAKRQNRRMRELEQTQFSLELLKVRTHRTGGTLPEEETNVPPCPDSISCPLDDHQHHRPSSPHLGSPDSHGRIELLDTSIDVEVEAGGPGYPGCHVNQSVPLRTSSQEDSVRPGRPIHTPTEYQSQEQPEVVKQNDLSPRTEELPPMLLPPIKEVVTEATRATFYIPPEDQSSKPKQQSPNKRVKERRESASRRPVVVVISMQKETLLDEGELRAAKAQESALQMGVTAATFSPTPIAGLEVSEKAQPSRTVTKPPRDLAGVDMSSLVPSSNSSHGLCPSEVDIQIVLEPKAPPGEVPPSQQERKADRPAQDNWVSTDRILESREAALASQKKTQTKTVIVNMTEKSPTNITFSPRRKLPFSKSDKDLGNQEWSLASVSRATAGQTAREATHKEEQKSIHKTMSSGDLGKVAALRKTSSQDGSRVRGKIRFWGKTKHAEKKLSRDKQQSTQRDGTDKIDGTTSPPHSPNLMGTRGRETKENKEPSPKVRRRRSVKISSVVLEPAQWGNDALHILTSTHDYRSMNDFLMKKISDLDSEDCQKDTLVDVVFKKALKEFRLNIFNSYSTALAMDDGKSIRYKDLYALFEHILEKSMRLEQRDWSESPVKVWVNTFKVFLDEFMTEYKPMDGTIIKASKPERKKRRKKEPDIVEEHNGHIFKSTQYSIPTYCEYCSSLIWMMDRACVCKLCRYACHRKCCTRMTTKCSKRYDLELSSRQFGVEVSRLTSEERTVPLVVEKLINYIEMHGLYTEGIFRKSGSTNKIKELRQGLDTDVSSMNLDDYNIHVIAGVLKQWLRDLPNPLMTFELYEEFLRAMGQPDKKEVIRGVYSVIDLLSRTHLSTLERLIFHLVRIALQEDTNRMSANALAIVFAPCILRCPDTIDPLQSVQDIGKTTACVELIIGEQMNKYRARLKDINSLEFAENKAKSRLTHIRKSMKPVLIAVKFIGITRTTTPGKGRLRRGSSHHTPSPPLSPRVLPVVDGESAEEERAEPGLTEQQQAIMQQEERVLTEQIESLQREKEELTYEMLILEPRASDDETLESEASTGTADSSEKLYMDPEGAASNPSGTYHSRKSEAKSRRCLRRQPDSVDSTASSSSSIIHQSPNYRFRSSSSGPLLSSGSLGLGAPLVESEEDPSGTVGVKSRHRLRLSRSSPREAPEGHRRESDFSSLPQQLVLYGSNEFVV